MLKKKENSGDAFESLHRDNLTWVFQFQAAHDLQDNFFNFFNFLSCLSFKVIREPEVIWKLCNFCVNVNDQLLSCCFTIIHVLLHYTCIIFIYLFINFRGFSISEDTQVVLSDDDSGVSAFVSFCLFVCGHIVPFRWTIFFFFFSF